MKKMWNKVTATFLMLVMVVTTVLGAAPALSVKAEPVTMGRPLFPGPKSDHPNSNSTFQVWKDSCRLNAQKARWG